MPVAKIRDWLKRSTPQGNEPPTTAINVPEIAVGVPAEPPSSRPMLGKRLVGIGHSHLQSLIEACALRQQADPEREPKARFVQMLGPELSPTLVESGALNPDLLAALDRALDDADGFTPTLFDCVSGNEYHFIGLVNHPRRFDFVLPSRPDMPLVAGAEIIPATLMHDSLKAQMGNALAILSTMAREIPLRFWHVQSPPPLPDNEFIRRNPTHFGAQIEDYGVSPASLRMKLWLLQSQIYRTHCETLGIGFVPVPTAALDAEGFLDPRGWLPDPAHAGSWYGELVAQQLDALPPATRREAQS